jgi:protoporphyrinogen oxidase
MSKIAIIGGGMTGMVAARELAIKGFEVDLYERSEFLGGLLAGFMLGKSHLEKAYHHIFKTDGEILGLIKELGLEEKMVWKESSIAIYNGREIQPFVTPIDLLKFKGLDLFSKVRLGIVSLWLAYDKNWQKYEKVTAVEWIKKYCGSRAYKVIWEPLLKGKFHDRYEEISMAWLWARIHTRSGSKDKNGKEYLGYMTGGFEQLIGALEKELVKLKVNIYKNETVDLATIEAKYDRVVYTGPLKEVEYLGAICIILESSQNLSSYYWHNINDLNSPFLAFIQQTNLIDKKHYRGNHVYYLGSYLPQNHEWFDKDQKEVEKIYLDYLKKIFPNFERKKIKSINTFRFKTAQHLVTTKYKVPEYKVSEKIYQANFAQIYPEDRGTNFAVREGKKMAIMIEKSFEI